MEMPSVDFLWYRAAKKETQRGGKIPNVENKSTGCPSG